MIASPITLAMIERMAENQEIVNALHGIRSDLGTLKTDLGTLRSDVSDLKADISAVKTDVGHLTDLSKTLHNKVDTVRANQELVRAELRVAVDSIADLRRDFTGHNHP